MVKDTQNPTATKDTKRPFLTRHISLPYPPHPFRIPPAPRPPSRATAEGLDNTWPHQDAQILDLGHTDHICEPQWSLGGHRDVVAETVIWRGPWRTVGEHGVRKEQETEPSVERNRERTHQGQAGLVQAGPGENVASLKKALLPERPRCPDLPQGAGPAGGL